MVFSVVFKVFLAKSMILILILGYIIEIKFFVYIYCWMYENLVEVKIRLFIVNAVLFKWD